MIIEKDNGWYVATSNFGKEVIDARNKMGITQADLAKGVKISPSTICRIETGITRLVSSDTVDKLEKFLGIKFTREDNYASEHQEICKKLYKKIEILESENAILKNLLIKYWKEEVTNG